MYNTTTKIVPFDSTPLIWGYLLLSMCIIFFGSVSLPVKIFKTGDGFSYQLSMCAGIWSIGAIVNIIRSYPQFYFLPMLGGLCWTTGNISLVSVLHTIGIGLGSLISGTVAIIAGWLNARFGLLGTKPEVPRDTIMNYFGVIFSVISAFFFLFIKPESDTPSEPTNVETQPNENEPLLTSSPVSYQTAQPVIEVVDVVDDTGNMFANCNTTLKRIIGTCLAVLTGIMFALAYVPYLYVMDNYPNASPNSMDYIFSMYCGIFLSSIFYFGIYCMLKKNRPYINAPSLFPGLLSGWVWGIANCSFLFANTILSQAITFPIAGAVPSVIGTLYGIYLFKEIKGRRNYIILLFGISFTALGALLCALSK